MDTRNDGIAGPPARSRRWARIGDAWLEATIECSAARSDLFDLALSLRAADAPLIAPALQERYSQVSLQASHPRYAPNVLAGSEIVELVNMLSAADEPEPEQAGAPARASRTRRRLRPLVARPQRLATAFALLAFLFPAVAFIPAVASADGGGVGGVPAVTTPTTPSRTPTTPTDPGSTVPAPTVTTPTDTTPTDTTVTATTPTDTTPTVTTPTDTTPTDTTPTTPTPTVPAYHDYTPGPTAPAKTITVPVKPAPKAKPAVKPKPKPAAPKPKPKKKAKKAASTATTAALPAGLLDPTPPALRLDPAFAQNLTTVSASAHVDWALLLAVIRTKGGISSTPATEPAMEAFALRLAGLDAVTHPRLAAQSMLGSEPLSEHAVALVNYYHAVGLPALVRGLNWAQPALEKKVLSDPRVQIYAGGRSDIQQHRVDVRVLAAVEYLAQTYDQVTVSCLISGHRLFARPGVISAHHYGRAVDIAAVDKTPIAYHQQPGGITERAVRSLLLLPPEMMPSQVISLLALGGPSFALADHWNHIHIGYAPALAVVPGTSLGAQLPAGSTSLLQLWQAAGASYGVPWQVLAAINKVESNFGQNMGPSSAGAVGWMQFMPSTWAKYAVDANGDGVANPSDPADAIFTAARYLNAAGASTNLPQAIFAYNHAQWYVNEVLQLASLFGGTGPNSFAYLPGTSLIADDDGGFGLTLPQDQLLELDQPFSLSGRWAVIRDETPQMQDRPYSLSAQWQQRLSGAPARPGGPASWIAAVPKLVGSPLADWFRREGTIFQAPATGPAETFNLAARQVLADRPVLADSSAQAASVAATPLAVPQSSSTGTP